MALTKPLIQKYLPTTSFVLKPFCRLKSRGSRLRKSMKDRLYPEQNHDYFGTKISLELPELEALLHKCEDPDDTSIPAEEKSTLLAALQEANRAIRREL
ncbi:MAG: hypothetical protein H6765_00665 [Candidatus Peribacteria bacterium]|nr:MAG: hypothetical protein H6765_00665 [Candidatus Peribacteria bacterium]